MKKKRPTLVFFRNEGFYPIDGVFAVGLAKQARDNAELNPGTVRVEDGDGNVLWDCEAS